MKKTKTNEPALPKGFRQTGTFTFEGKPVDLYMDRKSGQLAFVSDNELITDPEKQNAMMSAFQLANKH